MFISPEGICAVVVPCCCVILACNARQPIKKLVHVKLSFPGTPANWWCGFSGGTREGSLHVFCYWWTYKPFGVHGVSASAAIQLPRASVLIELIYIKVFW